MEINFLLSAMCDSNFASDPGSKIRWGYFFFAGGALVSWTSTHSTRIMSSSTEAECHGLVHTGKENIWQREFLDYLGCFEGKLGPTEIFQDNTSAITLATSGTKHKRSKHFGIEFDLFHEYVSLGEVQIIYRNTNELAADMLTKNLAPDKFAKFRDEVMGGEEIQTHFQSL